MTHSDSGSTLKLLSVLTASIVTAVLLSFAWNTICHPLGSFGAANCMPWVPNWPLATRSLLLGIVSPRDASGAYIGYDKITAAELNRRYPTSDGERITGPLQFIAGEQPSTGPTVVSVNAIDQFTWGAAALSREGGPCFLILRVRDSQNPTYGEVRQGILPAGQACLGVSATAETVTARYWPVVPVRQPAVIVEGVALLLLGIIMSIVGALIVLFLVGFAGRRRVSV